MPAEEATFEEDSLSDAEALAPKGQLLSVSTTGMQALNNAVAEQAIETRSLTNRDEPLSY